MEKWKSRFYSHCVSLFLGFFWLLGLSGCTNLAFQPSRFSYSGLESMPGPSETFYITLKDRTKLGAWWVTPRSHLKQKGCILHFHGNAQNRTAQVHNIAWLAEEGYALYAFDYRGYGDSEGKPEMNVLYRDHQEVLEDFIKRCETLGNKEKNFNRIVFAQSLGGYLAIAPLFTWENRHQIDALVLEGTFSSLKSVGRNVLSRQWLTWPFQGLGYLLLSDRYASKDYLGLPRSFPVLVVHGNSDPVIDYKFGRQVYELLKSPKEWLEIPRGQHLDAWFIELGQYRSNLLRFLDTH